MLNFFKSCVVLVLLAGVFAGCVGPESTAVATRFSEVPTVKPLKSNRFTMGDSFELSVEIDGRMEVTMHRAKVDVRGIATLPLVGEVRVGGMTLESVRRAIAAKYSHYYVRSPVIMLTVVEDEQSGEWGQIKVMGRVGRPGLVALTTSRGMNLSAAIQSAGGFSASAKTSDIRISRRSKKGEKMQIAVNFDEIGRLGNAEADLKLFDGDIVYVPERIF